MALNDEMSAVFKSSRTDLDSVPDNAVGVDPESGNEIPLGSLPEEVRDDIPAQLSEGEYVVPADVVRYYGVKFFEDLRAEAKFGYQDMEQNGRIGGDPTGMEMVEPEDDMMFDISELEVMEVPDEPVGAFFGGFFSKKEEKSPEQTVQDRFDAVSKREKQKRTVIKNADGTTKTVYSSLKNPPPSNDDNDSGSNYSGPSIAEQINFGGDYEDVSSSSSSSGSKPKPKKESAASKTVRKAYTGDEEPGFFDKIKQGIANDMKALGYAEGGYAGTGGYALSPGDEGYEELGSLGLGSEGIPLGTGQNIDADSVIEMVAYVNEEGRVIYIMHINGVPQNEVPPGFYIRTEEESTTEEDATDAQPAPQVVTQSDDDGGSIMPESEPIDYQNLTIDEMQELMDDMNSPTTKAITLGVAAMAGPVGLLLKGAMMHQERQLRKEMERRLGGELTTQDRARLEGMIQESEGKKGGIFGSLKGKAADLIIGEEQGPGMDIQPPKTYTPEVAAGSVTAPLSPDTMSQIDQAAKDAGDAVRAQQAERARQRKAEKEAAAAAAAAQPPISDGSYADDTGYSAAGTGDVLSAMEDRGASEAAITAAENEAAKIKSNLESTAKGGKMGFKKGGLASKKKK